MLLGLVAQILSDWDRRKAIPTSSSTKASSLAHTNWSQLGAVHDVQVHHAHKWDGPGPTADVEHLDGLHTTGYFVCSHCWMISSATIGVVESSLDQVRVGTKRTVEAQHHDLARECNKPSKQVGDSGK